jgi:hypothetical protein
VQANPPEMVSGAVQRRRCEIQLLVHPSPPVERWTDSFGVHVRRRRVCDSQDSAVSRDVPSRLGNGIKSCVCSSPRKPSEAFSEAASAAILKAPPAYMSLMMLISFSIVSES